MSTQKIDDGGRFQNASLRDVVAAHAMQALIPDFIKRMEHRSADPRDRTGWDDNMWDDGETRFQDSLTDEAYRIADAMISARNQKGSPDQ